MTQRQRPVKWLGSLLTRLCWKNTLVVQQLLQPGHDEVDVRWGREGDESLILIWPEKVEPF